MSTERKSIEKAQYQNFCRLYNSGYFGSQRFGQAFHSHFKLSKMTDHFFDNLYEVPGRMEAERIINKHFEMV